jgi:hypothetical protein
VEVALVHLDMYCNQDDTAKARAGGCSRHPGQASSVRRAQTLLRCPACMSCLPCVLVQGACRNGDGTDGSDGTALMSAALPSYQRGLLSASLQAGGAAAAKPRLRPKAEALSTQHSALGACRSHRSPSSSSRAVAVCCGGSDSR